MLVFVQQMVQIYSNCFSFQYNFAKEIEKNLIFWSALLTTPLVHHGTHDGNWDVGREWDWDGSFFIASALVSPGQVQLRTRALEDYSFFFCPPALQLCDPAYHYTIRSRHLATSK